MSTYSDLKITQAHTTQDQQKCIDIRVCVFVDEQKYPLLTETEDPYDRVCDHYLATCLVMEENSLLRIPVGTVRYLSYSDSVAKLGRLAVLPKARRLSVGRKLVEHVIKVAQIHGKEAVILHAQQDKRGFYEKIGFLVDPCDEEGFLEDGTPHVRMWNRSIGIL
ncbi:acyl-CoA N-acyltransferase [Spinellus fusiger]|nr:acyl-CoA N-acyltransferase [Spinellus fusiger]